MEGNRNILIVAIAIVLNLVVSEIVLYNFFPQPVYAIKYSPWGWEHIPNISFKYMPESKESISYVRYNSDGFRGPDEYMTQAPDSTLRIAILGDSEAEGNVVDYEYVSGRVLEVLLNEYFRDDKHEKYRRAEVIKAGVYSYEPCQFLRLFEERVLKYQPEVVLVLHRDKFADDVFCNLEDGKLYYEDMSYTRLEYLVRYVLSYVKGKSQLVNYLYRFYRFTLGGDARLPEKLHEGMFRYQPPKIEEFNIIDNKATPPLNKYKNLPENPINEAPLTYHQRLMKAVYQKFNQVVIAYGGKLRIVVIAPTDKGSNNSILGELMEQADIPIFDLNSYIRDRKTEDTWFKLNGHWNEYGHFIAGNGLFDVVTKLEIH